MPRKGDNTVGASRRSNMKKVFIIALIVLNDGQVWPASGWQYVANADVSEPVDIQLDVKAGDRILFGKYSGSEIKLDGNEYLIMREDEVLGVIEGATKLAKAS